MTKLKSFVRLDFITVKPYFTVKTMLLYAACALFLTTVSENIASAMGIGMMLGTLFIGYPFALGEKANMDALYATLSVRRETVVLGRYLFALSLDLCAVLLSFVLGWLGSLAAEIFDLQTGVDSPLEPLLALSALFIVIQAIQLPLYFKFGYARAKFLSLIPFVGIMVAYMGIMTAGNVNNGLSDFLTNLFAGGMVVPLFSVALLAIVFLSHSLATIFYKKREF